MDEQQFNYGVEIKLDKPDSFLLIKETLSRMGIKSKKGNILYQSCHILHKKGHYYIVHFLELFAIDGRDNNMNGEDYVRRNAIARLLNQWMLCKIVNMNDIFDSDPNTKIDVIPYKDKDKFQLVSKYSVGTNKHSK